MNYSMEKMGKFIVNGMVVILLIWCSGVGATNPQMVMYPSDNPNDQSAAIGINGYLYYFSLVSPWQGGGINLWISDGTEIGTRLVKHFSTSDDTVKNLTIVHNTLYFVIAGEYGGMPWVSDGTEVGTKRIESINPDDFNYVNDLISSNERIYFVANSAGHDRELWTSDGTKTGTRMVKNINPIGPSSPESLTSVNGVLYFRASDSNYDTELWRSDGTAAGTRKVKDINLIGSSDPYRLTNVNGALYFVADDGMHSDELWISDGTTVGTRMVKDINPIGPSNPESLTSVNGVLYFQASDSNYDTELWRSDGTAAGTRMVKDINLSGSSDPYRLTNVNGALYFVADDDIHSDELWISDGTTVGTRMVKDINPLAHSSPNYLTDVNGTLYFAAGNPFITLWVSDGTENGTKTVSPNVGGAVLLTNVNDTLYFFQDSDGDFQEELWRLFEELDSGKPQLGSVSQDEWKYYVIRANQDGLEQHELNVSLSKLSADQDLYIKVGAPPTESDNDCNSQQKTKNDEICHLGPGSYFGPELIYIGIKGFAAGSYELLATLTHSGNILTAGEWDYYQIKAAPGDTLHADLFDLTADLDLYIKSNQNPTTEIKSCSSTNPHQDDEDCVVFSQEAVTWHVGVYLPLQTGEYKLTMKLEQASSSLAISKAGSGSGIVSSPYLPGIDCGIDCEERYRADESVDLVAIAKPGSIFKQWLGDACARSVGNRCTVDMGNDKAITAVFVPHVVINEMMYRPGGRPALSKWFELYNPTGVDINIDGMKITDGSESETHLIDNQGPLILPARSYLVLGTDSNRFTNGGISVDYQYDSFNLEDPDQLILVDSSGTSVDTVSYASAGAFPVVGSGVSMALKSPRLDNNQGENWCASTHLYSPGIIGTPGSQNDCIQADLAVTLTAASSVEAGTGYSYLLSVKNWGANDAENVKLTTVLPSGVAYVNSTKSTGLYCSLQGSDLICTQQRLEAMQMAEVTVSVTAPALRGEIVHTAQVTSEIFDPDTANNDAQAAIQIYLTASIGNLVWNDLDHNGIQDAGEPGIDGVTVNLLNDQDIQIATTTTASGGLYTFDHQTGGTYKVAVDNSTLPVGMAASPDSQGNDRAKDSNSNPAELTLSGEGIDNPTIDFGYSSSTPQYIVEIALTGTGRGGVTGPGISCNSGTCRYGINQGSTITLTAAANTSDPKFLSEFSNWGGDCSGTAQCEISEAASLTATFTCTYRDLPAGLRSQNESFECQQLEASIGFEVDALTSIEFIATDSVILGNGFKVRDKGRLSIRLN